MMKTCITCQLSAYMVSQNEGGRVSGVPLISLSNRNLKGLPVPSTANDLIDRSSDRDAYVLLGIPGPELGGFWHRATSGSLTDPESAWCISMLMPLSWG